MKVEGQCSSLSRLREPGFQELGHHASVLELEVEHQHGCLAEMVVEKLVWYQSLSG